MRGELAATLAMLDRSEFVYSAVPDPRPLAVSRFRGAFDPEPGLCVARTGWTGSAAGPANTRGCLTPGNATTIEPDES